MLVQLIAFTNIFKIIPSNRCILWYVNYTSSVTIFKKQKRKALVLSGNL